MSMLKNVLSANSYWRLNKELTKKLGLKTSIILCEIISKYESGVERNELIPNPKGDDDYLYFSLTTNELEESTTFGYKAQKSAVAKLSKLGLIKTILIGLPATTHFTIIEENINNFIKS